MSQKFETMDSTSKLEEKETVQDAGKPFKMESQGSTSNSDSPPEPRARSEFDLLSRKFLRNVANMDDVSVLSGETPWYWVMRMAEVKREQLGMGPPVYENSDDSEYSGESQESKESGYDTK